MQTLRLFPVLIVTGGIATGKSTFCERFVLHCPGTEVFDSDRCAHHLLTSAPVRAKLEAEFGSAILDERGTVSRVRLREIVFRNPARRERLEAILHPLVREECARSIETAARIATPNPIPYFLADVPLYYEASSFPVDHDEVIVVATDEATQLARLARRGSADAETARQIVAAQWPVAEKVARSDRTVWNAGTLAVLDAQVALVAAAARPPTSPGPAD